MFWITRQLLICECSILARYHGLSAWLIRSQWVSLARRLDDHDGDEKLPWYAQPHRTEFQKYSESAPLGHVPAVSELCGEPPRARYLPTPVGNTALSSSGKEWIARIEKSMLAPRRLPLNMLQPPDLLQS